MSQGPPTFTARMTLGESTLIGTMEFAYRYLHDMQSFLILKCFSTAAQTMSLVMLDVPGMHLSMSVVHSTNVLFSLLRGSGRAASA